MGKNLLIETSTASAARDGLAHITHYRRTQTIDAADGTPHLTVMPAKTKSISDMTLVQEWTLPPAATLGSSVRAKGILLEMRARFPAAMKKSIDVVAMALVLRMPEGAEDAFRTARTLVSQALEDIEALPVIPREIEDILAISTTERHRWLKDGRLPSAGTRTVKLRGRARKITFHVFDPRTVEDILDRDLISAWREEDAITAAENRRRAAWKTKLTRLQKTGGQTAPERDDGNDQSDRPQLIGWEEFERDGPLR